MKEEQEGRVTGPLRPSQASQVSPVASHDVPTPTDVTTPVPAPSESTETSQTEEQEVSEMPSNLPPMLAPESTIPEVVHPVEDIYDFDDMSGRMDVHRVMCRYRKGNGGC